MILIFATGLPGLIFENAYSHICEFSYLTYSHFSELRILIFDGVSDVRILILVYDTEYSHVCVAW